MEDQSITVKINPKIEGYEQLESNLETLCQLLESADKLIEKINRAELTITIQKNQN